MNGKHTRGPWRQGVTSLTPQTSRWTPAEIKANDEFEKRMVFSDSVGEGEGTRLVATCRRQSDAQLVAAAPDLLALLIEACKMLESVQSPDAQTLHKTIETTIEKLPKAEA
jgi:hypothetical protein